MEGTHEEEVPTKNYSKTVCGILIVVGIGLLSLGGDLMLESSTKIAEGFGISERIIALTIISAGISLPELAISIIAAKKGNVDIAVGNVVGSNIFKSFFILGASVLINHAVASNGMNIDLWLNVFASSILFIFIFTGGGRKIHKWEGISMVLIYAAYVGYLILHP